MNYELEGQEVFDKIPGFLQGRVLLFLVIAILTLKIIGAALYLPISQNYFFADITKIDLLNLLNENRQSLGLNPLTESEKLNQAAMAKAQDMVKNDYFAHESPQGITPWFWFKQVGYTYKYAGENLAVGFVDSKVVYDAWFNSPSHKANLLNSHYTQVGTAVLGGFGGNSIVVVQEFGSPLVAATVKPEPKPRPTPNPAPVVTPTPVPPAPVQVKETVPAAAVVQNTPSPEPAQPVQLKVLSGSTEYIEGPEHVGVRNLYLQMLNFIVYDDNQMLVYAAWVVLLFTAGCLIINGMVMFKVENRGMLVRPILLMVILVISLCINKNVINHLLPYQVII